jgi:hypothetical protein
MFDPFCIVNKYRIGHFYIAKTGHYYIGITSLRRITSTMLNGRVIIGTWLPKKTGSRVNKNKKQKNQFQSPSPFPRGAK